MVPSVQEARRSITKNKSRKKQKGEKRLQQNEASTGPSVVECKHPRHPPPKLVPGKRGEKRRSFGPAVGMERVGEKERSRGEVEAIAVGSL